MDNVIVKYFEQEIKKTNECDVYLQIDEAYELLDYIKNLEKENKKLVDREKDYLETIKINERLIYNLIDRTAKK